MKDKIIKGIIEFFLIVFSVLFAFYLEDVRQSAKDKKEFVSKLRQLRRSIVIDSAEFESKIRMLDTVDMAIQSELKRIVNNKSSTEILNGFHVTRFYNPILNWSLEKMLEDDSFSMLSDSLKRSLYNYKFDREFPQHAIENAIYEDDRDIVRFVFENTKYDFIIPVSQKIEYKVKDSTVLYSDRLKSYFVKKRNEIGILKMFISGLPLDAHKAVIAIDEELKAIE